MCIHKQTLLVGYLVKEDKIYKFKNFLKDSDCKKNRYLFIVCKNDIIEIYIFYDIIFLE